MNSLYHLCCGNVLRVVTVGSNVLFNDNSRAKISFHSESFIPTLMKVAYIERADEFETGLESFNGPGAYLVQDKFILTSLSGYERGQPNGPIIEEISFTDEQSYFQNPKLVTVIDENNFNLYLTNGSIKMCFIHGNNVQIYSTSIKDYQLHLHLAFTEFIPYIDYEGNQFKITKSSLNLSNTVSESSLLLFDDKQNAVKITSYMLFASKSPANTSSTGNVAVLADSFHHSLTSSGSSTLANLKTVLFRRHRLRVEAAKVYYCIVSLFQSSGSGKSRLCCELVYSMPGFYIVLRAARESNAYPRKNNISDALMDIYKSSSLKEPMTVLTETPYQASKTGMCLHLIAKIAVTYFLKINAMVNDSSCGNIPIETRIRDALRNVRRVVDEDFPLCSDETMLACYRTKKNISRLADLSVSQVSLFITKLLSDVKCCLPSVDEEVSVALNQMLSQFPFVLVIDEAPLLAHSDFTYTLGNSRYSGLQLFYRALGYLNEVNRRTNLMVLTLGTESSVPPINTPSQTSTRPTSGTFFLRPIVFSGNSDIFTAEVSKVIFNPTYKTLKNPLTFKELTCYGHALWSSLPFNQVEESAQLKLKNGNLKGYNMIPGLWMVRCGMRAAPGNVFASELVANRMATVFEVDEKLQKYQVYYPSDPNLALGARFLTDTRNLGIRADTTLGILDSSDNEMLFAGLLNMLSCVTINRGEYAEYLAGMASLKAIDDSSSEAAVSSPENYSDLLTEICSAGPQLSHVWKSKINLLEANSNSNAIQSFPDYHVVSVENFLLSQFGQEIAPQLAKFPKVMLNGLMNASHLVKLERNLAVDYKKHYPTRIPNCDQTAAMHHNVMDRALLCYGLRRQCGFYCPDRYPAYDYFFPVCLDKLDSKGRPIYTILGFQVKARKEVSSFDINCMNLRYHYVKCARADQPGHGSVCQHCEDDESMQLIFENQISVVVSLDGDEKGTWNEVVNRSGLELNRDQVLKEVYSEVSLSFDASEQKRVKVASPLPAPASTFFDCTRIDGHFDVNVSVWKDLADESERRKAPKTSLLNTAPAIVASKPFDRLHTIVWRGMSNFKHLFKHEDSIRNATTILAQDKPTETFTDFDRYVLSMLREGKHNLPYYNEVLQAWRGFPESTSEERFQALVNEYASEFSERIG